MACMANATVVFFFLAAAAVIRLAGHGLTCGHP